MTSADTRIAMLPCWQGAPVAIPLAGGLSNEIWKVTDDAGSHVVRFGTDYPCHHVDRLREAMTARAAHAAGFAPAVEYTEPGVMVTQFVAARTSTAADVRTAPDRMGHLLRDFHRQMADHVSGTAFVFWPFHVIRDYARTLTAGNSAFGGSVPKYLALARHFESMQVPLPIIFGHHDLLPANILDDGDRLWLIDYEYAGFGTAMFDLAGAASNAGMDGAETDALLHAYLGHPPDPAFRRAFDAMHCTSLLREAMWAMVSDLHLSAPGVDYDAYARENLDRLAPAVSAFVAQHGPMT
ncbi:MAG: phosphotransferase [Gemmobacter sp.]